MSSAVVPLMTGEHVDIDGFPPGRDWQAYGDALEPGRINDSL